MSETPTLSPVELRALELEDGLDTKQSRVAVFEAALKYLNDSDDPDRAKVFGCLMQSLAESRVFDPNHDAAMKVIARAAPCKSDSLEDIVKRVVRLAFKAGSADTQGLIRFVIEVLVSKEAERLSKGVLKKLKAAIDDGDIEDNIAQWVMRFRSLFRRCVG